MQVIDAFLLLNEVETMIIRLNELNNVVDKFVIVEAEETFSGKPRKLHFPTVKDSPRMRPFVDKIEYQVCIFPEHLKIEKSNLKTIWAREDYIRNNCLKKALQSVQLKDEDLFLMSDVDEIPSAAAIGYFKNCKVQKGGIDFGVTHPNIAIGFITNRLHFNFHCRSPNMGNW
jgi:beta-1,4-mannosyl-glycoprotein beta-1,4-N-acetylglucosaminyltransferase